MSRVLHPNAPGMPPTAADLASFHRPHLSWCDAALFPSRQSAARRPQWGFRLIFVLFHVPLGSRVWSYLKAPGSAVPFQAHCVSVPHRQPARRPPSGTSERDRAPACTGTMVLYTLPHRHSPPRCINGIAAWCTYTVHTQHGYTHGAYGVHMHSADAHMGHVG